MKDPMNEVSRQADKWREVPCDWCGSMQAEFVMQGPDLLHDMPGMFTLVRCSKCGLIRQNPQMKWDYLQSYYPDNYAAFEPIIDTEPSSLKRFDRRYGMWKRLSAIESFMPEGNLLDVGAGTGIFLAEAHRSGHWQVMGLEPNEEAADYIMDQLSVPVLKTRFDQAELTEASMDVLTMWNVLEHFDHPIAELKRAHSILKPGGLLVCSIPNLDSLEAKLFGSTWLGWDLPRHLYQFPLDLLEQILREIGFDTISMRCIATAHAAFGLTLLYTLKAQGQAETLLGKLVLKTYQSWPVRLALAPFFKILDIFKLSSLIAVFALKAGGSASP